MILRVTKAIDSENDSGDISKDGRRARGDQARANILKHSIRLAALNGLEGVSFGQLATEAGVAKANIAILFGNKESLQIATLERAARAYEVAIMAPAALLPSPLMKLRALVGGWFHFIEHKTLPGGCFMNAVSSEYRARTGRVRDWIVDYRAANRTQFRNLIEEAILKGELRADTDADHLVFGLMAAQAFANSAELLGDHDEFDRARNASLSLIDAALAPHQSPQSGREKKRTVGSRKTER